MSKPIKCGKSGITVWKVRGYSVLKEEDRTPSMRGVCMTSAIFILCGTLEEAINIFRGVHESDERLGEKISNTVVTEVSREGYVQYISPDLVTAGQESES